MKKTEIAHQHTTFAPTVAPSFQNEIRAHVVRHHEAGSGWARQATWDVVREWHNSLHGRDYFGETL